MDRAEAFAVRERRQKMRRIQTDDPLAKRARLIGFGLKCAETNPAYKPLHGCWAGVFAWRTSFRKLLMPRLRARLDARDNARRKQHEAEMRESERRWKRKKAERAAAKARETLPQLDLP